MSCWASLDVVWNVISFVFVGMLMFNCVLMLELKTSVHFRLVWLIATMVKASGPRRRWRSGVLVPPKSRLKRPHRRPRWRSGVLVCPESQLRPLIDTDMLQELINKLGDKDMDELIRHLQQCLPGCIVSDDGNNVDVDLGNATLMEQHRLAKYIEMIAQ